MLEIVKWDGLEKLVFESFLAIFLAGIHFYAFLLQTSAIAAMRSQSCLLVDARIVLLVKLNVHQPFPFPAFLIIVACPIRIQRVIMNARHKNTRLIVKQI